MNYQLQGRQILRLFCFLYPISVCVCWFTCNLNMGHFRDLCVRWKFKGQLLCLIRSVKKDFPHQINLCYLVVVLCGLDFIEPYPIQHLTVSKKIFSLTISWHLFWYKIFRLLAEFIVSLMILTAYRNFWCIEQIFNLYWLFWSSRSF